MNSIKLPLPEENSIAVVGSNKEMLEMARSIYYFADQYSSLIFLPESGVHHYDQKLKSQEYVNTKRNILLTLSPFMVFNFPYEHVYVFDFDREHATIVIKSFAAHPQAGAFEAAGSSVAEFWAQIREKWVWNTP